MCCLSAHLHNFRTKILASCYAMPAHLITKRVGASAWAYWETALSWSWPAEEDGGDCGPGFWRGEAACNAFPASGSRLQGEVELPLFVLLLFAFLPTSPVIICPTPRGCLRWWRSWWPGVAGWLQMIKMVTMLVAMLVTMLVAILGMKMKAIIVSDWPSNSASLQSRLQPSFPLSTGFFSQFLSTFVGGGQAQTHSLLPQKLWHGFSASWESSIW